MELVCVAVVELVEKVVILGVGDGMGVPRATHTYLVQQCLAQGATSARAEVLARFGKSSDTGRGYL